MDLTIRNAVLFDGTGAAVIKDATVVVRGGRVAEVRAPDAGTGGGGRMRGARGGPEEGGAPVVDAGGRFLMPGLINLHTHLVRRVRSDEPRGLKLTDVATVVRGVKNAREYLEQGVTTCRDVGARDHLDIQLRDAVNAGIVQGPRLFVSGRPITKTGGHNWEFAVEADGPDEVRKAVRSQVKAWVDVIKVMASGGGREGFEAGQIQGEDLGNQDPEAVVEAILARASDDRRYQEFGHQGFTVEEMAAAVDEAHLAGRRTCAHASVLGGVKAALRAGIDTIEHGIFLDDDAIELFHRTGAWFVPTVSTSFNRILRGREAGWSPAVNRWALNVAEPWFTSLRRAVRAGVPIATGTDAGGDMVLEVSLFVRAGMPPTQALRAGTLNAAQALAREAELGSIEAGKRADLILVDGNPLGRIEDLRRVALVVKDGRICVNRLGSTAAMAKRRAQEGEHM
ncbi:MAG: amidohydrolase family protein, partial [Armatimonadetes bacterium]|nr:amidohydrolase family protein [Armatimonadota bacterium]